MELSRHPLKNMVVRAMTGWKNFDVTTVTTLCDIGLCLEKIQDVALDSLPKTIRYETNSEKLDCLFPLFTPDLTGSEDWGNFVSYGNPIDALYRASSDAGGDGSILCLWVNRRDVLYNSLGQNNITSRWWYHRSSLKYCLDLDAIIYNPVKLYVKPIKNMPVVLEKMLGPFPSPSLSTKLEKSTEMSLDNFGFSQFYDMGSLQNYDSLRRGNEFENTEQVLAWFS